MATEWIAATTGLSAVSIASMTVSRFGSAKLLGVLNSLMSAPPEKALPAPVITIALTAGVGEGFFQPVEDAAAGRMPEAVDRRIVHGDDRDDAFDFIVCAHRTSWEKMVDGAGLGRTFRVCRRNCMENGPGCQYLFAGNHAFGDAVIRQPNAAPGAARSTI